MPPYPNYYQAGFQPYQQNFYPQSYQPMAQPQIATPQAPGVSPQNGMAQMPTQNQIQNGGFITVRSEAEARSYPVAPGTSVTFKHETAPYCYTKTMGFSQFEAPKFEKFRLVKEEENECQPGTEEKKNKEDLFATKDDLGKVVGALEEIDNMIKTVRGDVDTMKGDLYGAIGKRKTIKKAEAEDD